MAASFEQDPPRYDLIIIGAGAAGVCAAIEAAEGGLRALVLEAFPEYGGAAALSGGGVTMVDTPLQRALGIADTVELAFADWMACGGDDADPVWARYYLERSCEDLFRWMQARGVEWEMVSDKPEFMAFNSVPRWHRAKGVGAGIMRALFAAAGRLPVEWRCSTTATRLVVEDDAVVGLEVESAGERETLHSRAVLVATGGFAGSVDMLREHAADPGPGSRLLCGGAPQAQGKGHRLLEAVGAQFVKMHIVWSVCQGSPDYRDPTGARGLAVRGIPNAIWLNAGGKRFCDESKADCWNGTRAVLAQRPATCWAIFDRSSVGEVNIGDPYFRKAGDPILERTEEFLARSAFVRRADRLPQLAEASGLPANAFLESVEWFNECVQSALSRDPQFGRPLAGSRPIAEPPFYSVQFFPLARKCFGGVRTDLSCHVLRPDGSVIPGLYAAGEVAGMAGGHINGRAGLEGTMLGPSLFSGRVAGRAAVAELSPGTHMSDPASPPCGP